MPSLRADRTALIVSSTSWTPDEDFGMLLDALKEYERRARESEGAREDERLPKVLAIVTGKGPLKEKYMQEMQQLQTGDKEDGQGPWRFVRCVSLWLEADDYPLLLGMSFFVRSCWCRNAAELSLRRVRRYWRVAAFQFVRA